jgi:putative photosynthetic complex assembly protein 2
LEYGAAVLFALFLWWFSTGAVLYLVGLPKGAQVASMAGASLVGVLAVAGIAASRGDTSILGAYCAFTCALLVWAWHEMSFLTGLVMGPNKAPCPPDLRGWRRFVAAAKTLIYHELAILVTAGALVLLTWGAANQIGVLTFLVLWIMRLSAKLNVFLGVPNLTEEFLPDNLVFLKSYFARRPMNLLFPAAVTAATIVTMLWVQTAAAEGASGFTIAGYTLLATLLGLAVLEHWFLVLPLPAAALWSWGLISRRTSLPAEPNRRSGWKNNDGTLAGARQLGGKLWAKKETPMVSVPGRLT